MRLQRLLFCVLAFALSHLSKSSAETLTFIAQLENGVMNYNWFSAANWFRPGPDALVHANRLPAPEDSVYLQTDVNAAGNLIHVVAMTVAETVSGGNFDAQQVTMLNDTYFVNSTVHVSGTFATFGLAYLNGGLLNIDAGASALLGYGPSGTSGSLGLSADAIVNNQGSFVLQRNTAISALGNCAFVNNANADVRAQDTALITGLGRVFRFDNRGTIRADAGTLALEALNFTSETGFGTFLAATPDSILHFRNSNLTIPEFVTFTFKGPGLHRFTTGINALGRMDVGALDPVTGVLDPGRVELAAVIGETGSGNIRVRADAAAHSVFTWLSGHLGVAELLIEPGAELFIAGSGGNGASYFDAGAFINHGTVKVTGSSGLSLAASTVFENHGLLDLATDADIFGSSQARLRNFGQMRKSNAEFFARNRITPFVENRGHLDAAVGTFQFLSGASMYSGGEIVSRPLQTMTFAGNGLTMNGGALTGNGTISGPVYNLGLVSPAFGTLTTGPFTQPANGKTILDLSTPAAYDQIVVNGLASLDGTISIRTMPAEFSAALGDEFTIVRFTSRRGNPVFEGLNLGNGRFLRPVFDSGALRLVVSNAPLIEPMLTVSYDGAVHLSWPTVNAQPYQLEFTNDLIQWFRLYNTTGDGSPAAYTDPVPAFGGIARIYRVR